MKLSIAKTFKLGGKLWHQIWYIMAENVGDCDLSTRIIRINPEQDMTEATSTQLHEWLEAVNDQYGVDLEHQQIELLEKGLYEILTTRRGTLSRDEPVPPSDTDPQ